MVLINNNLHYFNKSKVDQMKANESPRVSYVHLIRCQYVGPTATRGSKIKLTSGRFGDSISAPYDSLYRDSGDQGLAILRELDYTVLSTAESWNTKDRQLECNLFAVKDTDKQYSCAKCGHKTTQRTNHYGATWSFGHFNTCPNCPPYAKYPEFGGSTLWECIDKPERANSESKT